MERDGKFLVVFSSSSYGRPPGTYGLPTQGIKRAVFDVNLQRMGEDQ
jgi:hypothetical protein